MSLTEDFASTSDTNPGEESHTIEENESDLGIIDEEIEKVKQQITAVEGQRHQIALRRLQYASHMHEMRQIEDTLYTKINILSRQQKELAEESQALDEETQRVQTMLHKYMQLNILNDAFHIWYAGPYGTINNFRLGSIPIKPIDSNEINAALGQAVLVLHTIASNARVEFKQYSLIPMGSFPRVYKLDDKKTQFPLYLDPGSFSFFPKRNFNNALLGLMSCVHELGEYVAGYDPTMAIPYKIFIAESRIGDVSFIYGTDDEAWTKSLKYMLSNVKWIVAWYTKHGHTVLAS